MERTTILLVEDNPADLLLIKEHLAEEERGLYDYSEAQSLKTAFEQLSHHEFDAILLDLNLPDSAGLETVRKITTRFPETAVIVLTGLQDDELALQAVRYGAQDFIEKGRLTPSTLSKSIRYSIERKKTHQEKEDLLNDLSQAIDYIERLETLLPFCLSCKKILAEDNYWYYLEDLEQNVSSRKPNSPLCPQCRTSLPSSQVERTA